VDGFPGYALFLAGISYAWPAVRSWGFWAHEFLQPSWIGPRHTNFFDGSICAFEPTDKTWVYGDPLIQLLDLYSVWALRQLHLRIFDEWPGGHIAHYAIERVVEQRENEICGCGATAKRYAECCRPSDLANTTIGDAVQFAWFPRTPPSIIMSAIDDAEPPAELGSLVY
jgi:hypothetical protein